MQQSLSSRRSLLERENALLLEQEAEFERKRIMLRSKGNDITGVFKDDSDLEQNPFEFVHSSVYHDQQENPFDDPTPSKEKNDLQSRGTEDIKHQRQASDESWSDFMMDSADEHITKEK